LVNEGTGEIQKEVVIHIFKPENVGEQMCIDEKMIGKRYYIILSNLKTGKIGFLLGSMNPQIIGNGLSQLGKENLEKVVRINCDMSPMMKKLCEDNFINAKIIIDKFHVIKHLMDAMNTVRLNIKKSLKIAKCPNNNNPNRWTDLEFLEKCKYLTYRPQSGLDAEQATLVQTLLEKFPKLKEAYDHVQQIRNWYSRENIGKHIWEIERTKDNWMVKLEQSKLKEFKQIHKMFEKHEQGINRFFENGSSNAKAENLNARIQRFLSNNFGLKDKDFFFFRTQIYFA
jgi:transposase